METGVGRTLVQLSSDATTFNTTLNLTGPIILGLSIATASLLYAYYTAYPNKGYLRRHKRSLSDGDTVLHTVELVEELQDSLALIGVNSRECQLQAICRVMQDSFTPPLVDTVTELVKLLVYRLRKVDMEVLEELLGFWLKAAEEGQRGDKCEEIYSKCDDQELQSKLSQQFVVDNQI